MTASIQASILNIDTREKSIKLVAGLSQVDVGMVDGEA